MVPRISTRYKRTFVVDFIVIKRQKRDAFDENALGSEMCFKTMSLENHNLKNEMLPDNCTRQQCDTVWDEIRYPGSLWPGIMVLEPE